MPSQARRQREDLGALEPRQAGDEASLATQSSASEAAARGPKSPQPRSPRSSTKLQHCLARFSQQVQVEKHLEQWPSAFSRRRLDGQEPVGTAEGVTHALGEAKNW